MKYTFILIAAFAFMLTACGETSTTEKEQAETASTEVATEEEEEMPVATFPADSIAEDGTAFYGMRISQDEGFVAANALAPVVAAANGKVDVRVTGEVTDACKVKGCWMMVKTGENEDMRVRFQDYGFFVPKDCAGKTAFMEGTASYDTTSIADLRHYAVDGGMTEAEAEAKYTEPEVAITFLATGVILK